MFARTLINSLLLLPLLYSEVAVKAADGEGPEWNYDNTNWGKNYTACNGKSQSPINLKKSIVDLVHSLLVRDIKFANYDVSLMGPLTLTNNGKTAEMIIPPTTNGMRPSISGGIMNSVYELQSLHFHWGALGNKGSEHTIKNLRYDAELHMVHKNSNYDTLDEAVKHKDGLAVIGIFLKIVKDPQRVNPALEKIFETLPDIVRAQTSASINDETSAGQFLGDTNTKKFYTYSGSLTTPACAEAVTWIVFPEPLHVSEDDMQNFWNLRDDNNNYLLNNYRPLQRRNRRPVYYRASIL